MSQLVVSADPDRHSYNPSYPHARCLHGGTMLRTGLVMFGGCLSGGMAGGPCPSGDSWLFNTVERRWHQLPNCATPRNYPAMAVLPTGSSGEERVVLFGGAESGYQAISVNFNWTHLSKESIRQVHIVFQHAESPADQVGILNPVAKTWSLRKTTGEVPSKRFGMALVTATNGVFMFGGSTADIYLLSGTTDSVANAPLSSQKCNGLFFSWIHLHGVFMFISWGVLLQLGAFLARYLRHKDPLWFKLHRIFQVWLFHNDGCSCVIRLVLLLKVAQCAFFFNDLTKLSRSCTVHDRLQSTMGDFLPTLYVGIGKAFN